MADQCSAYTMGRGICANGFPVNAACMGSKCWDCGRPTDKVPACMNEDIAPRWLNEDGSPRHANQQEGRDNG